MSFLFENNQYGLQCFRIANSEEHGEKQKEKEKEAVGKCEFRSVSTQAQALGVTMVNSCMHSRYHELCIFTG
jgi:hypothetical protein